MTIYIIIQLRQNIIYKESKMFSTRILHLNNQITKKLLSLKGIEPLSTNPQFAIFPLKLQETFFFQFINT
jgi:hypothetical protein